MGPGLPAVQLPPRPGIIDLGPGTVASDLLPSDALAEAARRVTREAPALALTYGANEGAGPLRDWLLNWLPSLYGGTLAPDELLITAGASGGLDRLCTHLSRPGDVALVQSPTYYLALELLTSRELQLVPVPDAGDGPEEAAFAAALERVPREQPGALFYSVPIHGNPTGRTAAPERWRRIYELARARGITVVHDEVYAPLSYDGPLHRDGFPLSAEECPHVVRLGSFSKLLGPGLRVGWMIAGRRLVSQIAADGLSASGGGASHWAAMVVATLCREPKFGTHLAHLVEGQSTRRDAMALALRRDMSAHACWRVPRGGFFMWLELRDHLRADRVLAEAESRGVSFTLGASFFVREQRKHAAAALRLAFSDARPDEIRRGVRLLADSCAALQARPAMAIAG
jgi:2-aminoadipate transaminase